MKAAVLGSPIAHSLSPVLHHAAYAELGLPWTYESHDVDETSLPQFLAGLDDAWAGLSLTMPLKRAVLPLLDWASPTVRAIEAANTVVLSRGRRLGANTDVPGMSAAFTERGITAAPSGTVVVLGGGATATSALAALHALGVDSPVVVVRRPHAVDLLRAVERRLGQTIEVRPWADAGALLAAASLVVSTVPGGVADPLAPGLRTGDPRRWLLDVAYDPWPSALALAWERTGGQVIGGLDLLVHQAVLQVALMTGRDAEAGRLAPVMQAAGQAELARRAA